MDFEKYFNGLGEQIAEKVRGQLMADVRALLAEQDERLISPAEAARLFVPAVSTRTLSAWVKDGRIPSYSFGRRVFFKKSEIIQSAKLIKKYKAGGQ